jgi:hypothetical protein
VTQFYRHNHDGSFSRLLFFTEIGQAVHDVIALTAL